MKSEKSNFVGDESYLTNITEIELNKSKTGFKSRLYVND